jgi:1,4-alpha-glucan branching enzyme
MIQKELASNNGKTRVIFELSPNVDAEQIHVVGCFCGWDPTALPMRQEGPGGNWRAEVELEAGRRYRFRYLIDGTEWLNDWHADDHEENPYGSYDSVVDLTGAGGWRF